MKRLRAAKIIAPMVAAVCAALCGCDPRRADEPAALVAAGSSYLECAARDLLGDGTPLMRLAEPGMCPGHFDLRPAQVQRLRRCRVLLRFSFQASLDRQASGAASLTVVSITAPDGMCVPDTYLAVCRQAAGAFVRAGMLTQEAAQAGLAAIEKRIASTGESARQAIRAVGLHGAPVLASGHQAAFCRYLGLRVVAAISGSDTAAVRQIDDALRMAREAGCRLVVANRPEGTQLAESIADRLGAKVVVFDNFPDMTAAQPDFDSLVRQNVRRLVFAAGP